VVGELASNIHASRNAFGAVARNDAGGDDEPVPVANLELNENMVLASNCDYAVGLPASGPHGMREW